MTRTSAGRPLTSAFAALATMCAATTVAAQATRPTAAIEPQGCVTDQCHAAVKQHKVVHGPVNVNACDACHTLTSAEQHTYALARDRTELCTFCHQIDTAGATMIHQPLADGECLSCHDPHGGFDRNFVRSASMNALCNSCHQDVIRGREAVHGPVAAGACGACHAPHASNRPKLLVAEGRELCLGCHREMEVQMDSVQFAHEPVKEACTSCHDAHASDHRMMLRQAAGQLCTTACHEDVAKAVAEATYKHSAVTGDVACVNCHNAHGGDLAALMKDQPVRICLTCHKDAIVVDEHRTVASVAEMVDPDMNKHGPIREGSCGGCHDVHGAEHARLLNKPYPPTFYDAFAVEHYELCFECHNREAVLVARTDKLTGFRNGDRNLHYLHVNKDKRGRTCRACHSVHASRLPVHIRESVPYGNWELPIAFTRSETGGTCSPGCHQPLSYDRENPVALDAAPSAVESAE